MKTWVLLFFLCLSLTASSQTVLVQGAAKRELTNELTGVFIVRNDTIAKYQKQMPKIPKLAKIVDVQKNLARVERYMKGQQELAKDTNYVTKTTDKGTFRIRAARGDTLIFKSIGWESQKHAVKDLLARGKIEIILEKEKCIEYLPCKETAGKTYIFLGEKISVNSAGRPNYCDRIQFDSKFTAQYKVIQNIENELKSKTITFTAYDHYGEPAFSQFKYVLLFVTDYCGELVHQKYQYFDVYPTADGRWASPGDPYRFEHVKGTVKAKPIVFRKDIEFNVEGVVPHLITRYYPEPWYKLANGVTRPVSGVYVEDLVRIKKDGVLKARGISQ